MGWHMGQDPLACQTTTANALALLGHGKAPIRKEERGGSSEQKNAVGEERQTQGSASRQLQTDHNHRQDTNTQAEPAEDTATSAVALVAKQMQPLCVLAGVCSG